MHPNEFESEGRALARPCVYLRSTGDVFAGTWRGAPAAPQPAGPYRHWLSVDARHLPVPASGVVSFFTNEDDCTSGAIVAMPTGQLPETAPGVPLFAVPGVSLPPLEAVFAFGSPAVHSWLKSLGWQPEWGYNDNFPEQSVVGPYERLYQGESPFYSGGAHAVLGGWHLPWPDGDWPALVDATLLLWTFAESEPWVEGWSKDGRQWVVQRVT